MKKKRIKNLSFRRTSVSNLQNLKTLGGAKPSTGPLDSEFFPCQTIDQCTSSYCNTNLNMTCGPITRPIESQELGCPPDPSYDPCQSNYC